MFVRERKGGGKEALAPKEKSDNGQKNLCMIFQQSTPGVKVKDLQGLYINYSKSWKRNMKVFLCIVIVKSPRVFGFTFSHVTGPS